MFSSFRASLNILSGKNNTSKHYEFSPDLYVNGAYKASGESYFGSKPYQPENRTVEDAIPHLRPNKSTSDLTRPKPKPEIPVLRNSVPEISTDPRGAEQSRPTSTRVQDNRNKRSDKEAKRQEREAKKLEKQRLAEQKERDKQAAIEQAKLKKERDRKEAAKVKQDKRKKVAPQPQTQPKANPLAQRPAYSTNTLESSISQSSGPPPYSEKPNTSKDPTGNVSFSKPIDEGSWDLITQHRQQINRPLNVASKPDNKNVMDLKYDLGYDNSDA